MSILSLPTHRRHHRPDEAALLGPATHRAPAAVGSAQPDPAAKPVRFDDVTPPDFHMPPGWVPARGADQLRHEAVRDVLDDLAADRPINPDAFRRAFDPFGVPAGFQLRTVDPHRIRTPREIDAESLTVLDEIELALARFACAVSDLAARPGGAHALRMLLAPVVAQDAEVAV